MRLDAWKFLTNGWDRAEKERARLDNAASMFFETVSRNDWLAVSKLIQSGCSPNMLLGHKSALMVAAEHGALECLNLLISTGSVIGAQDEIGRDALFHAIESRQDEAVRFLLSKGPRVKRLFNDNATALILAAKSGYVSGVDALVKYDKNMVNMYDRMGRTALWHVLSKEDMTDEDNEIARILMDGGASADMTDLEGVSAREAAQAESARSLVERADLAASMKAQAEADNAPAQPAPSSPKRGPRI